MKTENNYPLQKLHVIACIYILGAILGSCAVSPLRRGAGNPASLSVGRLAACAEEAQACLYCRKDVVEGMLLLYEK